MPRSASSVRSRAPVLACRVKTNCPSIRPCSLPGHVADMPRLEVEEQIAVEDLAIGAILVEAADAAGEGHAGQAPAVQHTHLVEPALDLAFLNLFEVGQFL